MKKKITGYQVFSLINNLFMVCISFVTLYPVYYVVIASFSDTGALSKHVGALWLPLEPFTLKAYETVFSHPLVLSGYKNTLFVLAVGLLVNMALTMLGAFCLTIKGPMLSDAIAMMIVFTMYFSGGIVPKYFNVRDLGLLNSLWALILPGAIGVSNMIIMKTAFKNVPESLVESARLDGASYLQILVKIMMPLTKATMAVILLYYGVSHWNAWFEASIYLQDSKLFPLQLVARNILQMTMVVDETSADDMAQMAELIKYALIVVSTVPILTLYPFLQKYFTKGVMIGAVKG